MSLSGLAKLVPGDVRGTLRSTPINIDNGAGTTYDEVIGRLPYDISLLSARAVYTTETSGTVAAATVKVGTAVNGGQIVAATNLQNSKAVGTITALTLATNSVAADTPVIVRHTGVAETAAGVYIVEIDYAVKD